MARPGFSSERVEGGGGGGGLHVGSEGANFLGVWGHG